MLRLIEVDKSFPGVHALKRVSLEVRPHEIVGLIGENGAGKSTLMKILTGVYQPDSGRVELHGKPVSIRGPRDATDHGIGLVFQEQSILTNLSIAENLFLGREDVFSAFGRLDWRQLNAAARKQLDKVHLDLDPRTLCSELSFGQRQMVELAKSLALEDRSEGDLIILLDEPTSMLEQRDIDLLFKLVRELKSRAAFVFISHRLDEVLSLSDRIYVMKDGEVVAEMPAQEATAHHLHELMVGRSMHSEYYREALQKPYALEVVLSIKSLARAGHFQDVSLDLHKGEVLGIAGVIGSGREELCRALVGFEPPTAGEILVEGRPLAARSPTEAVRAGIGYIPRERKVEGLVMMLSVAQNMTLARIGQVTSMGVINHRQENRLAQDWISRLHIKTPSTRTLCQSLSGGNQQKIVLAKWRNAGSRILVLDHPTRGLDVGAKEEVYQLVREMTAEGVSVILTADTLEETIGLCHTILVMKDGRVTRRFDCVPGAKPSQLDLIEHMV